MEAPTVGITILVIISVVIMGQLLMFRFEQSKRHKELRTLLERLEKQLGK